MKTIYVIESKDPETGEWYLLDGEFYLKRVEADNAAQAWRRSGYKIRIAKYVREEK